MEGAPLLIQGLANLIDETVRQAGIDLIGQFNKTSGVI
jgi:hypothetical protein